MALFENEKMDESNPLVNIPYTYQNIVDNPIVKPVSEADRRIRDLEEMIYKKSGDIKKDQEWISANLKEFPVYSDSLFISKLLKLFYESSDIIKLQSLQMKTLKSCITEIFEIVSEKYGVKVSTPRQSGETVKMKLPKETIPEGSERNYLEKLSQNKNQKISKMASEVLAEFDSCDDADDKKRFQISIGKVYGTKKDDEEKKIIGSIARMEI